MQINKIVSSAKIITITDLVKGNVIKFIDTQYSEEKLKYAIVTDVLKDNENTYIYLITFDIGYNNVEIKSKLLSGNKNFAVFPATPEEVSIEFGKIQQSLIKNIEKAKTDLQKMETDFECAKSYMDNQVSMDITEPQYITA